MVLSDGEKPKTLGNEEVQNHSVAGVLNKEPHLIFVDRAAVYPGTIRWQER